MFHHVRRFARPALLPAVFVFVGCQQAPSDGPADPAGPANELVGVWSLAAVDPGDGSPLIDPSQPGLYIFADEHYSAVFTPGPDVRTKATVSFQPTEEEMIEEYESIIVNAGTYEIDGSTVTFRPVIAKSPGFVGGRQSSRFSISGDTLVLNQDMLVAVDGVSPPDFGGSLTLLRIE